MTLTADYLGYLSSLGDRAGFWEAIDDLHKEIIDGMELEDMPLGEAELLGELGAEDPEAELVTMMILIKSRRNELFSDRESETTADRLEKLADDLRLEANIMRQSDNQDSEPRRKSPKWFKGLGKIARGTGLSLANIALVTGGFVFPGLPTTASWGTLVSAITGVGIVYKGASDLRRESRID